MRCCRRCSGGIPRVDAIVIDGRVLLLRCACRDHRRRMRGAAAVDVRRLIWRARWPKAAWHRGPGRGPLAALRVLIVTSQVAVTCVLVVGAMLLVRSFTALSTADRGYDPANILTAAVPFPAAYPLERKLQVLDAILQRMKERPGVTHVARSTALPLASAGGFSSFTFPSPTRPGTTVEVETIRRVVTPEYFGALGISRQGRPPAADADNATAPARWWSIGRSFESISTTCE